MRVKIPENPPELKLSTQKDLNWFLKLHFRDEMVSLVQKANREYLYWDDFKYLAMPPSVKPELAWHNLKFTRRAQAKHLPLKDKNEKPFSFWLPDHIQEHLHFIDSFAGGQISLKEPVLNPVSRDQYLVRSLMEEAISSSMLEGAATTRKQAKEMLLSGKKPESHGDKMVYNNYLTMSQLNLRKEEILTPKLLNDIHRMITEDTLKKPETSGKFRNDADNIVISDHDGNTLFVPPPANEIEKRIAALIDFANKKDLDEFIHPVVKAVILHFWLAYIHPYVDGNGRTARALFYWHMIKNGYWLFEYLSISRILLKRPAQYARAYLYSENDEGDITYFLSFNLKVIRLAIEDLKKYIEKKQDEMESFLDRLRGKLDLNSRQHGILRHALKHPGFFYTIERHQNTHGVVYETARTDLLGLAKKGIMRKVKKGKAFYFVLEDEARDRLLSNERLDRS